MPATPDSHSPIDRQRSGTPQPFTDPKRPGQDKRSRLKQAWRESHGTALLGFAAVIVAIGLALIWTSPSDPQPPDLDSLATTQREPQLPEGSLLVRVTTNKIQSTGPIQLAVYDSRESFGNPEQAIIKDSLMPINGFAVWEIKLEILPERFAIAAYHDLDDDGELNRALFNAPVEPYGFSNNARSLVGPPTYEQTIVEKPAEATVLEIRVY